MEWVVLHSTEMGNVCLVQNLATEISLSLYHIRQIERKKKGKYHTI